MMIDTVDSYVDYMKFVQERAGGGRPSWPSPRDRRSSGSTGPRRASMYSLSAWANKIAKGDAPERGNRRQHQDSLGDPYRQPSVYP